MEQLTFAQQLQQFVASHTIMVVAWVALLVAVIISLYKGATNKFKIVDNAQATQLINKEDAVLIDIRTVDEFKAGHIIESVNLTPTEVKTGSPTVEKYKERQVIIVDANGLSAQGVAGALTKHGFTKVAVLKEGVAGWRAASLPLVKKHK
ncbi:rhodanese-like domain-containing protein [Pasteurellaceae bacterium 15-036681]|nr:rhodanese-like domain-containing protein [Pasteurellaceae bacterium 15-036681]